MDNTHNTVWIIDDDQSIRWVIDKSLQKANFETVLFETASKALIQLKKGVAPSCVLCDLRMPGIDGFEFIKQANKVAPDLPIIIMTAYSDLDTTVEAYQGGAFEYLPKPFDITEVVELTRKACNQNQHNKQQQNAGHFELSDQIIGESPALQDVFRIIGRLSKSHISMLIEGETGTGKELVAQAIHQHSPRADEPFISINTAAIPQDALESELFGNEQDSNNIRQGRLEKADKGTLFFDEIGDMPMHLQTRLLRVLSEGEIYRVGAKTPFKVDVRIMAATHHNLKELVDNGSFRNDLYHRLNVIRLHLPPLRNRQDDIPLLLNHFLQLSAKELNEAPKKLNPDVSKYLSSLAWSGNVRQLENTCRWFTVMATGNEIGMRDLPEELLNSTPYALNNQQELDQTDATSSEWHNLLAQWLRQKMDSGQENIIKEAGELFERTLLEEALLKTNGRKQDAARIIGWGRNTITRKIKDLGL